MTTSLIDYVPVLYVCRSLAELALPHSVREVSCCCVACVAGCNSSKHSHHSYTEKHQDYKQQGADAGKFSTPCGSSALAATETIEQTTLQQFPARQSSKRDKHVPKQILAEIHVATCVCVDQQSIYTRCIQTAKPLGTAFC
jgi:hypothetical protein